MIHLSVPRSSCPTHIKGVVVHRVRRSDSVRHPYLLPPRTRVEGTILDLVEESETVENAFNWICRATGKGLTNVDRLRREIAGRDNLRWRAAVLEALEDVEQGVRSHLEYR